MRWKKILIALALVIILLIVAAYAFLSFYDFTKFKPVIAQAVKEATGRELKIGGKIDFKPALIPTLSLEDVRFQNAPWGSRQEMVKVKCIEIQIALLPMIKGDFEFARLVLLEPDFFLETDRNGKTNIEFGTSREGDIRFPPLIIDDVHMEGGLFTYKDGKTGNAYSLRLDRLDAVIPGLDQSIRLKCEGAYKKSPFMFEGTVGSILAWIETGHSFPVDATARAGDAFLVIKGAIRDPVHFKNLAFDLFAEGPDIRATADLAGVSGMPDLGAFDLKAKMVDSEGKAALDDLVLRVGSEDLVEISLTGGIKNLLGRQGVNLDFAARGNDVANLTKLGLPASFRQGAFHLNGRLMDSKAGVYSIRDLKVVVDENEIHGHMDLTLAGQVTDLTVNLTSRLQKLGPVVLKAELTGTIEALALKKLDLHVGTEQLAQINLTGTVQDLQGLKGVDLNFGIRVQDLGNLEKFVGHPLPVRGAFYASGRALIPVHKKMVIPELKITMGRSKIDGSLDLDFRGRKPRMNALLSSRQFDLRDILTPELAGQAWAKAMKAMSPFKLGVTMAGFEKELSVERLDLKAGTDGLAEVEIKGAVGDLIKRHGIQFDCIVRGRNAATLEKLIGQPLPVQGAYAVSGQVSHPAVDHFDVNRLEIVLGENTLKGRMDVHLANRRPRVALELASQKINLQSMTIPAIKSLTGIPDLGPLKLTALVIDEGEGLAVEDLEMSLGREELVATTLKGTVGDLAARRGFQIDFSAQGKDLANLKTMGLPDLPLKGAFSVSGRFTDPEPEVYEISSLKLLLGENDAGGLVALNLTQKRPQISASLSSQKMDLRPVLKTAGEGGAPEAPPAKNGGLRDKVFSSKPLPLNVLTVIDLDARIRANEILLPRLALNNTAVDVLLNNGNLEMKPVRFEIGGGSANGLLTLHMQEGLPVLELDAKIGGFDVGRMLNQLGYPETLDGKLNADAVLIGSGRSTEELMAALDGKISVWMNEGRASGKYLDLLQDFLGTNVLRLLNPFKSKQSQTKVNCWVNQIEIREGMADCKLLLDTDQTSILGAGDVNLKTEELNLGIKPTPKKGFGLSGLGAIKFSLRELSSPFRLGGTLKEPSLALDPKGTAFTLGKFAGALALGPAGIAAFFADVSLGKKDPCLEALKFIGKETEAATSEQTDETGAGNRKEPGKRPGGFFGGLFRR